MSGVIGAAAKKGSLMYKVQRFCYYKSYFPSLGLWRDDMRRESPVLREALKRLPRADLEARNFRIARAVVLNNAKMTLPRDQWTELDEDVLYLDPVIKKIEKEIKDKEDYFKSR